MLHRLLHGKFFSPLPAEHDHRRHVPIIEGPWHIKITQPYWLQRIAGVHDRLKSHSIHRLVGQSSASVCVPTAGIPPPPPETLHSAQHQVAWASRWMPKDVGAMDFVPGRRSAMIHGRPVQVLMVTHQDAPPHEWDSYFNACFRPLRPLLLYGPTASIFTPNSPPHYAVLNWWKVSSF